MHTALINGGPGDLNQLWLKCCFSARHDSDSNINLRGISMAPVKNISATVCAVWFLSAAMAGTEAELQRQQEAADELTEVEKEWHREPPDAFTRFSWKRRSG